MYVVSVNVYQCVLVCVVMILLNQLVPDRRGPPFVWLVLPDWFAKLTPHPLARSLPSCFCAVYVLVRHVPTHSRS